MFIIRINNYIDFYTLLFDYIFTSESRTIIESLACSGHKTLNRLQYVLSKEL